MIATSKEHAKTEFVCATQDSQEFLAKPKSAPTTVLETVCVHPTTHATAKRDSLDSIALCWPVLETATKRDIATMVLAIATPDTRVLLAT